MSNYDDFHNCQQKTICNKKCPAIERIEISSVVIKETAFLHSQLNQSFISTSFIFEGYRKGIDYSSQNLDTENNFSK